MLCPVIPDMNTAYARLDPLLGQMTCSCPTVLAGATLLSVIDFFLSFVVIAGIGFVLAAFPHLKSLVRVKDKDLIED